jgi:hypothetical protein
MAQNLFFFPKNCPCNLPKVESSHDDEAFGLNGMKVGWGGFVVVYYADGVYWLCHSSRGILVWSMEEFVWSRNLLEK